jgi:hypothetical protein
VIAEGPSKVAQEDLNRAAEEDHNKVVQDPDKEGPLLEEKIK